MKKILLCTGFLFAAAALFSQTVWNGPLVTFSKAAFANPALAANQDRITPATWITRGSVQGLYNAFSETGYATNLSPANTEWATGTLANYASLTYRPWEVWAGGAPNVPSIVGVQAVLHLIAENIYIGIRFTAWGVGTGAGGSFAYERTTANVPVPVRLTSFTASKTANAVALTWTTAAEENTAFFTVERSGDGRNFSALGQVAAAGNSAADRTYGFTDAAPERLNFYRLRTADKNGSVAYSQTVALKADAGRSLQLSPVPAAHSLNVQVWSEGASPLQLIDAAGRIVKRHNLSKGSQAFALDVSTLKPGLYFLRSDAETKAFVKK